MCISLEEKGVGKLHIIDFKGCYYLRDKCLFIVHAFLSLNQLLWTFISRVLNDTNLRISVKALIGLRTWYHTAESLSFIRG
jgi:hypothetical protein